MRGLEKKTTLDGANTHTQPHTDGHGNSRTELAQWGQLSENSIFLFTEYQPKGRTEGYIFQICPKCNINQSQFLFYFT